MEESRSIDLRPLFGSTLLVVAAAYGVLLYVALRAELFGIPLALLIVLSLWRFAYAVLRDVARGRRSLPAPGPETANPVQELSLALHAMLFTLLALLLATTPLLGKGVAAESLRWLGLGVWLVVFPASATVMGVTGDIAAAMNPFAFATVIRGLGSHYLLLMAACGALVVAATSTAGVLASSGAFGSLLGHVVSVWAFLALFALIGSVIFARRADLDLVADLDVTEMRDVRDRDRVRREALNRAYASIRSGYADRGYRTIEELMAAEHESLDVYDWIFNQMLDWDDSRHALELAVRFIARLVEADRYATALRLIDQCRALDPAFNPSPASAAALGAYARATGRPRLADELDALTPPKGGG